MRLIAVIVSALKEIHVHFPSIMLCTAGDQTHASIRLLLDIYVNLYW